MEIIIVLLIGLAYLALLGLAMFKLIKSKLLDWDKIYWGIAIVLLQFIAFIAFIVYHDYFLDKDKRAY